MVLIFALAPSKPWSAVIMAADCVAFCEVASCAVAAWLVTPTSTCARSGWTETLASPTAVMVARRGISCAQDAVVNAKIKIDLVTCIKFSPPWKGEFSSERTRPGTPVRIVTRTMLATQIDKMVADGSLAQPRAHRRDSGHIRCHVRTKVAAPHHCL